MLGAGKMPKWGDDSEWNGINGVLQCAPPAVDLADWLNLAFVFTKIQAFFHSLFFQIVIFDGVW